MRTNARTGSDVKQEQHQRLSRRGFLKLWGGSSALLALTTRTSCLSCYGTGRSDSAPAAPGSTTSSYTNAVYLPIVRAGFDAFADNFSTPGALGPRWIGSTWTVGQDAVSNTPALGPDVVTDGDMELNWSWSSTGSPTANERSNERAYEGANSPKIVGNSGSGAVQHDIGAAGERCGCGVCGSSAKRTIDSGAAQA